MELTKEEKQALLDEATERAKAEYVKEAQPDVDKITKLIKDQQTENDKLLKGKLSEAEFKTSEEKRLTEEKKLQDRIDALEIKIKRPGREDPEQKARVPGAAEYKKAFFNYLRTTEMKMDKEVEKYLVEMRERKALVSDTTGQIFIPEELESEIYRALPNLNVIRKYATIRPITRDRIRRRSMTEVDMGWGKLELGAEPVEQDVTPSEDYQYVEDLEGLARIGKDELADSDVSLEALIVDSFSRARARKEETAFAVGTGHSNEQPDGITNGTTVTNVETAASDAIVFDDVINLIYEVPAQYRRNGVFMTASSTMKAMRKLKDSENQYLWQPSLQAGQPPSVLGYPVEAQEDLGALTTALADIAIFGDFKAGYRILDREGMRIQRLIEVWATAGLVGILVSSRVTGGVIRSDALRILKLVAG